MFLEHTGMEASCCQCPGLEAEVSRLSSWNTCLETQNQQLAEENRWLREQYLKGKQKQFGSSSERITSDTVQCEMLFNEAEVSADTELPATEQISYTRKKKQPGHREEMLSDLPVETREYRLPDEDQFCKCCGGPLHEMSAEERKELQIVRPQVKVISHVRYIYSCRHCERHEIETPIVKADAPGSFIEKSLASPSAVAYIMGMKFVEGMPLYRQEQSFGRMGIALSRSLLSNWVLLGGEMLHPIYSRMKEKLIGLDILHADETTLQVLKEPGRKAESKSYMWMYRSGRDGPPMAVFEYQPGRDAEYPKRFLEGVSGYLHADGYQGYDNLPGVTLVGCWSHARRGFMDALKILPKSQRNDPKHLVNVALAYINRLFAIERELKDVSSEERKAVRDEKSKPVTDAFKAWLDEQRPRALPKSQLGQAIGYCLNQWSKLTVFLTDGRLELDNNRSERTIKPFVIGRKNWLFANTPRGARVSALIYSIVESAKENGLDPTSYLEYLFERLPGIVEGDASSVDELLPWSDSVQSALRRPNTASA